MLKRFFYLLATDQLNGLGVAIIKVFLRILSWAYHFLVALRSAFYRIGLLPKSCLPLPVISIGNLTVGGTGKTPLVEYIARFLKSTGVQPVILTRGYMDGKASTENDASDEAQMLAKNLSNVRVLTGSNRVKNAREYLKSGTADVFLLDDGFQHLQLSRDFDIVTIDSTNPWGNRCLLPRGILRESRSALKRANAIVITKTDLSESHLEELKRELKSINPRALIAEAIHKPESFTNSSSHEAAGLDLVRNKKICAMSSIGAPRSFSQTLTSLNADIQKHFAFMDHHNYSHQDIARVIKFCRDEAVTIIVTTEKDVMKLSRFVDVLPEQVCLWSLKIKMILTSGEDEFFERIHHIL